MDIGTVGGVPETCYRTVEMVGHSHTVTLVRHQAVGGGAAAATDTATSGADPTAP
jgi:hypothetical protein